MKKNRTVSFISLTLIFSVFLLLPSFLFAQVYGNIGFKKDVPEEIRKACPMCDEFLDVKWVDDKRNIGKLKAEMYRDGKKEGIVYLLVKLEDVGSDNMFRRGEGVTYDITKTEYSSKDFERFVRGADYTYDKGFFFMTAEKGGKKRKFSQGVIPSRYSMRSYANFSKTLCIPYPNVKYAFVAETKKPFIQKDLSKDLREKYERILKFATDKCNDLRKKCDVEGIKYCDAIDVNYDGLNDYVFHFNLIENGSSPAMEYIFFSQKGKYKFQEVGACFGGKYYMPIFYAALEKGEAVYYAKCNLTQVTTGGN